MKKYSCEDLASIIRSLELPGFNLSQQKSMFASYIDRSINITEVPDVWLDSIHTIGESAFSNCDELALTSLPEGITSIGNYAFSNCGKLALTSLPEGITNIGSGAFGSCTKLALTSLPESITSIGSSAFYNCYKLTNLTFKGTPTSISSDAFSLCRNLTTINVPWAEGVVANAPWGATNATINYNYTGE
jgi:hypothetical protein